jgi:hypothetical protein
MEPRERNGMYATGFSLTPAWAKLAAAAAAALCTVMFFLTAGASNASADSYGCTWAPYGNVCILIEGSGLYVRHVRVRRAKIDYSLICNYQARMTVRTATGRLIDSRWSPYHRGCTPIWAWFDWYPRRIYPNNSKACTAFFEGGVLQGKPCNYVHS